jgi:hypothetical protein
MRCIGLYFGDKQMKCLKIMVAILLTGFVTLSQAQTATVSSNITRTLVADDNRWGGCMVLLDIPLADAGLNCPGRWVSFSCSGTFTTKDVAFRMFDSAQMAYSLGHAVDVFVDDTKKHNGYCYANRIDVQGP